MALYYGKNLIGLHSGTVIVKRDGTTPLLLQTKYSIPTKQQQTITYDSSFDGIKEVIVEPIPEQYIVPTGTKKIYDNGVADVSAFKNVNVDVKAGMGGGEYNVYQIENDDGTVNINITDADIIAVSKQSKTVTPTEQQQTVRRDDGYDFLDTVIVNPISSKYIGSGITMKQSATYTPNDTTQTISGGQYLSGNQVISPVPTETKTISENGTATPSDGKYFSSVTVNVQPPLDTLTVTPSESEQTKTPTSDYYGFSSVTVNPISKTYVGSSIPRKSSTDLTASGATVTVPSGYYASQATKTISSGSEGTPSANKGTVSNHTISITPTVTNSAGYISGGTKTGSAVTVSASELVSGSETKTSNGTYDVTNLAQLVVALDSSYPTGIEAIDYGSFTISSAFTTTQQTFNHNLGVTPDFMIVYADANIATTYSMLAAIRGNIFGWRSSAYNSHYAYHGNSTTTVTWANSNNATYGISGLTATQFKLASHSTSYYWRASNYHYIAIKFS